MSDDKIPAGKRGRLVRRDNPEINIDGTLESLRGMANAVTATRGADGRLEVNYGGGTDVFWDGQATVERDGERIFIDENGDEVPESGVMLVEES